jgi:hypothetical protein
MPDRRVVERTWAAVADGSLAREVVHEWSVPWVEGDADPFPDVMVNRAMTSLHGFDMAASDPARPSLLHHGPPGCYYRTLDDVRAGLEGWRAECVEHDADPDAWIAGRRVMARALIEEERRHGLLGAAARRDAGLQDRFSAVRALAVELAAQPFPECRGEEIDGVDLALVDADLRGCVLHFLGKVTGLDAWHRDIVQRVTADLDRIQVPLPEAWAGYFRQADTLAHALFAAIDRDSGRASER